MIKRFISVLLLVAIVSSCIVPQKVDAVEVAVADLGWEVIATIIVLLAGKEIDEVISNNSSDWATPDLWEQTEAFNQEKLEFINLHQSISEWKMRDDVAQEFWRNVNQKEFDELKNLYNSNRNPDFYTGDGLNLAINLNIFKDVFKHFRDKYKFERIDTDPDYQEKILASGWWQYKNLEIRTSPNARDGKYALYVLPLHIVLKDRHEVGGYYYDTVDKGLMRLNVYENGKKLGGGFFYHDPTKSLTTNGIVFNNEESAKNYILNGTLDGAINSELYTPILTVPSGFMPNTKTVLPNEINEIDELKDWITAIITPTMPSTQVIKIIGGEEVPATGIYDLEPDNEDGKYFTIIGDIIHWLQKIYNFIISIPNLIIEWLKKIYDFLVELPEALINGIKNLLEWLFVPDTVALLPMVDLLRDKINNSISIATYPLKIILNLFDKLSNLSASECILIFPELNFLGKKLNDEYVFNFTQFVRKDEYKRIYKIYRSFTSFIMILAVLTIAMKKFNENLKG